MVEQIVVDVAPVLRAMRHEVTEKAVTGLDWALPAALAVVVAALLLVVSFGKRLELWALCIGGGLVIGLLEFYGSSIFGSQWRDPTVFVVLVLVLLVRPTGLLGESLSRARV